MSKLHKIPTRLTILLGIALFTSCGRGSNVEPSSDNAKVYLRDEFVNECQEKTIKSNQSTQWVIIQYTGNWNIEIVYQDGSNWIKIQTLSGKSDSQIWAEISENNSESNRKAILKVSLGNKVVNLKVEQLSKTSSGSGENLNWLELPKYEETNKIKFVTHSITIDSETVRSFSILYDTENHYPIWVAYPMHSAYLGNSGRTDNWQYDPQISKDLQPNLENGMGNGYDRGHMLPSGSRTSSFQSNSQTFYYTNMTAQLNSFNSAKWAETETKVRTWRGTGLDTLYVVTGAVLRTIGGNETVKYVTNRNDGKKLPVPNYYYKVVLKRSAVGAYKSIGLWFKHEAATGAPTAGNARSVRWIEEKTGLNFFGNLPQSIQDNIEKTCNPSQWGLN